MDSKLQVSIGVIVLLAIGSGIGYYFAPAKIVEKTKIVEVEKKVVDRDIVTKTTKTTSKDGTVTENTTTVDRSKETSDRKTDTATEKLTIRSQRDWLVTVGVGVDVDKLSGDRFGWAVVQKRLIGELYIGVLGTSQKQVGAGLTFRF